MLLRSMTKHVKDQNWFAVALDFFIVVFGILIAFQITNWSEGRADAVREQETLIAILEDLKADRDTLKSGLEMAQVNINASNYTLTKAGFDRFDKLVLPLTNLNNIGGGEMKVPVPQAIPETQKSQLWKLITLHYYPRQNDAAWRSLVSAGNLNIIKNGDMVHDLQRYATLWSSLEGSTDTTYLPLRNQTVFTGQEFGLSPFSHIPEQDLLIYLQENPKLLGAMRTLLEYTVLHQRQIENVDKAVASLIEQIEGEIKP